MCIKAEQYPKVLLWGHAFDNYSGMGITLTNMFYNWPKDRIAISADTIPTALCEEIRPCAKYIPWSQRKNVLKIERKRTMIDSIKDCVRPIVKKFDFREIVHQPSISNDVVNEIKSFAPDVIFCSLGSLASMKHLLVLNKCVPKIPIVLYIVDDWPNTRHLDKGLRSIWKKQYDRYFRQVLNISSGFYSICQYMSDEYLKQYGKKFYPIHNPVDLNYWDSIRTSLKYGDECRSILYVGKINRETRANLHDMCKAVERLNGQGIKIIFDVYSPDSLQEGYQFAKYKYSHILPAVDHTEVPVLTKKYNYLFLTLGFSSISRMYAKLSMPTKLSEYMASDCPTILYCPKDIALAKYIADHDAALMCFERKVDALCENIEQLIKDENRVNMVKKNARKLAEKHNIRAIRLGFEQSLRDVLER